MGRLRSGAFNRAGSLKEKAKDAVTSISDRTGGPIGSGSVSVSVDPDTGNATESIVGRNMGSATPTRDTDNVQVATVRSKSEGTLEKRTRAVENVVEKATGGAAFGDDSVENVGGKSNPAVTVVGGGKPDRPSNEKASQKRRKRLAILAAVGFGTAYAVTEVADRG